MSGTGKKRKRESGNPGGNDFYDEVKEFNKTIGDLFLSPSDERDDKMWYLFMLYFWNSNYNGRWLL